MSFDLFAISIFALILVVACMLTGYVFYFKGRRDGIKTISDLFH